MKRRVVYLLTALLSCYYSKVEAFSQEAKTRIQPGLEVPHDNTNAGHGLIGTDRRKVLVTGLGIFSSAGTIVANPTTASAVDFGNNGPNKARLGGLANKIRNICNNMVSIFHKSRVFFIFKV